MRHGKKTTGDAEFLSEFYRNFIYRSVNSRTIGYIAPSSMAAERVSTQFPRPPLFPLPVPKCAFSIIVRVFKWCRLILQHVENIPNKLHQDRNVEKKEKRRTMGNTRST